MESTVDLPSEFRLTQNEIKYIFSDLVLKPLFRSNLQSCERVLHCSMVLSILLLLLLFLLTRQICSGQGNSIQSYFILFYFSTLPTERHAK